MHIVHIEDFFHPDAGYQVNILSKYLVKMGHQVTVITGEMDKIPDYLTQFFGREHMEERDRAYEDAYGVQILRLPLKGFVSGRAIFDKKRLLSEIRRLHPDVLFAHGNDTETSMWLLWNRKKLGCPLITDSHMLEMASTNRLNKLFRWFYRRVFAPLIVREHITVIRTQNDPYVEKCLGVPLSQAPWISYGSDTMLFHPDAAARASFRQAHGIPDDAFVVVYAGKLDEAKGGQLLADTLKEPFASPRPVVFIVVGNTVGEYGQHVEQTFSQCGSRLLRFPTQTYAGLAPFFQAADLAVFPRQCSLSFYDVQACGLPVLFEDNSINVDRASHGNGWTFAHESVEDFRKKLTEIFAMDLASFQAVGRNAQAYIDADFDYAKKAKEYDALLEEASKRTAVKK